MITEVNIQNSVITNDKKIEKLKGCLSRVFESNTFFMPLIIK